MKLISDETLFREALENVLDCIAMDSLERAIDFNRELENRIDSIPHMPFKYRKSIHFNDDNIRDYIFKGYTIPYIIDTQKNEIIILDIFKWVDK